ncbi:hypothetical protein Clacol_000361 [Clathrus columnatus]|uniref:Uncharacterized protein n=1 Tax=Clathrus columnatus TaxID=1419009 RepID=A0AAV4ZYA0_9AGAM|nr:hypothetical protein Clacol_000361 [Clathrus columnatus]
MCSNHHRAFDAYDYFIRYIPAVQKFIFVNYSGFTEHEKFHGRAVALDITHRHAPFPSLFIIHEMRVRGHHPFQPIEPLLLQDASFQEWIVTDSLFDDSTGTFDRDGPPLRPRRVRAPNQLLTTNPAEGSSGDRRLALNQDVIQDILAATRSMPSWRACEIEGTSWNGTAEENIQKYTSIIRMQQDS